MSAPNTQGLLFFSFFTVDFQPLESVRGLSGQLFVGKTRSLLLGVRAQAPLSWGGEPGGFSN